MLYLANRDSAILKNLARLKFPYENRLLQISREKSHRSDALATQPSRLFSYHCQCDTEKTIAVVLNRWISLGGGNLGISEEMFGLELEKQTAVLRVSLIWSLLY